MGISFKKAVDKLIGAINQCNTIISHNILFDINVLRSELYRYSYEEVIGIINKKKHFCTMQNTIRVLKIPTNYGYKFPNLSELYRYCFEKELPNPHNSLWDTINLVDIVRHLSSNGQLTIK